MQYEQVQALQIHSGSATLEGELIVPDAAQGIVLFAHGSGSSRHSPRNQLVARAIRDAGVATLLFDLLTREEEAREAHTRHMRFDIGLLARRLADATRTIKGRAPTARLKAGYFGASTGGGAALVAAAEFGEEIGAVVSRGGRPDLAADALPRVKSPTLLIVGGLDVAVIKLNELAFARLMCKKELRIVPRATHLFEEAGTLEEVAKLAADWFRSYLCADSGGDAGYRAA
jgi:predicted alpha/beta-hydrolase family hydrolase